MRQCVRNYLISSTVNDTLLYLPWSGVPDNSTRNIGTIAFVLISLNSFGLGETVNETWNPTVWSWIADDTLSELHTIDHGSMN